MRRGFSLSVKLLPAIIFSIIAVSYFIFVKSEFNFEREEEKIFRKEAQSYIAGVTNNTKTWLLSQALMISHDKTVQEAYIENTPFRIKEEFEFFWKTLHNKFKIEEMHFFKYPYINFFSFSSISTKPLVLSHREDIEFIQSAFTPDAYFFICKRYPGLRASYPISYNGKLLGAVSFGISIETFRNYLAKPENREKVFYLLSRNILEKNLDKDSFSFWISRATHKDKNFYYFHIKESFSKNQLNKGFLRDKNKFVYFYPMKDFKGKVLGYIGISKDYSYLFNFIYRIGIIFVGASVLVIILVFLVCVGEVRYLENQKNTVLNLLDMMKRRDFSSVEKFCSSYRATGDIFDDIVSKIDFINKEMKTYLQMVYSKLKTASQKALTDALTEAFNRHALENVEKSFKDRHYSALMIDIDHFKAINDKYGHEAGDRVLKELVRKLRDKIRDNDKIFRYGGEEFVVLLPETSKENAKKLAERIRKHIEETEVEIGEGKKIKVTVSIGVAERKEGETIEDAIKRADEAMYRAKKAGRNRVSD
ncbi:GGDEF domain-containing protein [Desulfurobacterium atlanticum]|uniref:diguanylate cyclase n=1 Tax=Desulfurobacterium atlanticum TaxID=240169 RepID=A0A238Z3Z9_9BACT|nr:diguanylate cyclase [Desulfurobacterium atlanticum]SNR77611.1 diguanylate cyclase (GGDEF) domain-containing protein [Desulfurobacterium atlanticum]